MFENFPYSNFHDLNTDWLIKRVKNIETSEANAKASEEAAAESATAAAQSAKASDQSAQASAQSAQASALSELNARSSAVASAESARLAETTVADTANQINVLQSRVDNIIPDGTQTQGNTELLDIRVGFNGKIYQSAGDSVRNQVSNVVNEISNYNSVEFLSFLNKTNETVQNITYAWNGDSCTVTGSNTAISFTAMFLSKVSFPVGMKAGNTYFLKYSGNMVQFRVYYYESAEGSAIQLLNSTTDRTFTIPNNATGIQIRLHVPSGSTVNETVSPKILNALTNEELTANLVTYKLNPTGNTTDRKTDIEYMLNTTGVCYLGSGDFYVSGIDMPDMSKIYGNGANTRIILLGNNTDEGYAIKLSNNCYVESLTVLGNVTNIPVSSLTSTVINRHGILFKANYDTDQSTILRCFIRNVRIGNFTGGGITCINTGYSTWSCVGVTDCYIYRCTAGIYVPYWSEFHRFVSVHCTQCYYGAVNNGGNCTFIGCNFSSNIIGMLMDNSTDQSPNNSHGSVIGCTFDHEDNNNGIGIKIDGCQNGEVFSDCQLFYSDIEVNNAKGIQFNNFNIGGSGNEITITKGTDGGLVIFNGCVFKDDSYSVSVSPGYDACKFINCYTRDGLTVTV